MRSISRPQSRGRSRPASGQAAVSSFAAAGRTRTPRPRARRPSRGQADERRERRVRAAVAVERALELGVGALERVVVPVEAAARLGGGDEQRNEDRAPERLVLADPLVGVRAREDARGRLVLERREGLARVLAQGEPPGPLLDEGADERPVLVERRAVRARVLLERDREVGAALELEAEVEERAEAEPAERREELRRARRPARASRWEVGCRTPGRTRGTVTPPPGSFLPDSRAPVRHARVVALRVRADPGPAAAARTAGPPVDRGASSARPHEPRGLPEHATQLVRRRARRAGARATARRRRAPRPSTCSRCRPRAAGRGAPRRPRACLRARASARPCRRGRAGRP